MHKTASTSDVDARASSPSAAAFESRLLTSVAIAWRRFLNST